ncbi:uncharacterized protein PHACADRAFT_197663 [Phanerochaete carnosa HHB-10118-sp]|uniref:Uncharacterized protein n=1 Tax=Phanerochaete carnosa (strain HHB-10118-sp) TaxID=650164 RepID=K5UTG1_PHACS|nr:uncharacterized protein PHACADRAFT_197663 [Phanerochaete carnosa HHB-10118-sp]EKM53241.1 hypothetical protein PHACADRAFT_197663 [Phanerochaete carnosa HHB-10118-sp]
MGCLARICENIGFYNGLCGSSPTEIQDDTSSVGPQKGWDCFLFVNYSCASDKGHVTIEYPGIPDLGNDNNALE